MTYIVNNSFGPSKRNPSFIARIRAANALYKQRKALDSLTDEQLTDIGLTRREVSEELAKPLWV